MAEILNGIDENRYRAIKRPAWMGCRALRLIPHSLVFPVRIFSKVPPAFLFPGRTFRNFQNSVEAYERVFADRPGRRQLPQTFLTAWDEFIAKYGWRGPLEMDLASPRYQDDPLLAIRQMSFMVSTEQSFDPAVAHRGRIAERHAAYEELIACLGPLRRTILRRLHRVLDLFSGTRDTPKHHVVLYNYALRKRVLREGDRLVVAGRLDRIEDVFNLSFSDLTAADNDPALDLRRAGHPCLSTQERLSWKSAVPCNMAQSWPGNTVNPAWLDWTEL